jgi:hypothetical protein
MPCVPTSWNGAMLTRRPQWQSSQMHSRVARSRKVGSTVVRFGMTSGYVCADARDQPSTIVNITGTCGKRPAVVVLAAWILEHP